MASRLNPYINFADNAREAMEFYKSVFGGTLTISTYGEYGAPDALKPQNHAISTDNGSPDGATSSVSEHKRNNMTG